MNDQIVTQKSQLIPEIEATWTALEQLLQRLSNEQMTSVTDSQGWTIKDHIAHMTAWERSAVFLLRGIPRHKGMGIEEEVYLRGSEDEINAIVQERSREVPIADALTTFREVHKDLLSLLETLEDEDLQRPYRHYLPEEPGEGGDLPAMNVVYGNTAHHFREHQRWIESLLVQNQ